MLVWAATMRAVLLLRHELQRSLSILEYYINTTVHSSTAHMHIIYTMGQSVIESVLLCTVLIKIASCECANKDLPRHVCSQCTVHTVHTVSSHLAMGGRGRVGS